MKSRKYVDVALWKIKQICVDYQDFIVLLTISAVLLALLCVFLYLGFNSILIAISAVEDPTERGLAYIAAAIMFHAFFGKSNVDVKVDGKKST